CNRPVGVLSETDSPPIAAYQYLGDGRRAPKTLKTLRPRCWSPRRRSSSRTASRRSRRGALPEPPTRRRYARTSTRLSSPSRNGISRGDPFRLWDWAKFGGRLWDNAKGFVEANSPLGFYQGLSAAPAAYQNVSKDPAAALVNACTAAQGIDTAAGLLSGKKTEE